MKNIMMICLVFTLALTIPLATVNAGDNERQPHKVAICHFAGHDGDFVVVGKGCGCTYMGGRVIIVDLNACLNGHMAGGSPWRPEDTCDLGVGQYDELWDPEDCGPCPCWFDSRYGCAEPCVNIPPPASGN